MDKCRSDDYVVVNLLVYRATIDDRGPLFLSAKSSSPLVVFLRPSRSLDNQSIWRNEHPLNSVGGGAAEHEFRGTDIFRTVHKIDDSLS